MKKLNLLSLMLFLSVSTFAQSKKMTQETYDEWRNISEIKISNDGRWVSYVLAPEEGDGTLVLYNLEEDEYEYFDRAEKPNFDPGSSFLTFMITPSVDSIKQLKRNKTKDKDLPKDSLAIYHLNKAVYDKFARVKNYKIPKDHNGLLAFMMHEPLEKDSTLVKDLNKKNGTQLIVYNSQSDRMQSYSYVKDYMWSEKEGKLMIHHMGQDSSNRHCIDIIQGQDFSQTEIYKDSSEVFDYAFNMDGSALSLILKTDSLQDEVADMTLALWQENEGVLNRLDSELYKLSSPDWKLSQYFSPYFSEDGSRLYFGIKPKPALPDSTLLDSEKAELEIWNYKDDILYTQQKVRSSSEKKRSYTVMYELDSKESHVLSTLERPYLDMNKHFKSDVVLSYDDRAYQKYISWLGYSYKDVYLTQLSTGETEKIASKIQGTPSMSPSEKYVYWYNRPDTSWYAYDIQMSKLKTLTSGSFYDETNDRPMHPYPHGIMSWTNDDKALFIYDEYDIWKFNPSTNEGERLTQGREKKQVYRYIELNDDLRSLPEDTTVLVQFFDQTDKSSGYQYLDLKSGALKDIVSGDFYFSRNVRKAKDADVLIYTKESFELFPDLLLTDHSFNNPKKISDANPQQSEYGWGSIELFQWTDFDGKKVDGLLVKPAGFDPEKKYPMIINFYERSSDRLNRHRAPYPHRSTINYSYWANKGYVIFNPDVIYKVGYPGQSCYDAVMSGLDAVLELGFIDASRVGLQGHSWGGYQIADLLTRTNRFACAESGAPVVNMISAYGGIRWGSGMSRMFQHERTQSRLGGTLWETPELYMENSPIFNMDKVTTPVLILHNDKDGAVPWYQGIEYFVALRRLGKPAWLLNYNNEPHWPLKRPNRLDFNKRLEQFFDHYLMGQAMPEWMHSGVPAIENETNDGFKLMEDK